MRLPEHYRAVRERYSYDPVDFDQGDVTAERLGRRFAAVDGREAVTASLDRPTLVTTGVGMTGPPHLGTVGQIRNAIVLQEAGLDVQFVLADLEPYHRGADLDAVRDRAARFRSFVLDLGFDPDQGTLRTQSEARDVMHTSQLLARYYDPDAAAEGGDEEPDPDPDPAPTAWEASVDEAYAAVSRDPPGPTSEAAAAHSTLLHLADFLHPLRTDEYEQVVVSLGVDEHGLTPATRRFLRDTPVEGTVAGLHGRMVTGVGDAPKMGRSLPGSAVHLEMAPETIRERLTGRDADGPTPAASMAFQAMCLASASDPAELDRREAACEAGGASWERAKADYADHVVELAERW